MYMRRLALSQDMQMKGDNEISMKRERVRLRTGARSQIK